MGIAVIWLCIGPETGQAATLLGSIQGSPNITISLDSQVVADENVFDDDLGGSVSLIDLGPLPANAEVTAFHLLDNGDSLFAFDTTVSLMGGIVAGPDDIVRFDGVDYSLELDGSAMGVPAGARIDALSMHSNGDILMSFDITVALSALLVGDEDLVRFDGVDFSLFLDGSAVGISLSLDLDALHFMPDNGNLLLSFDSSGVIAGTNFDDEDLLELNSAAVTWNMAYDGSASHSQWLAADLGAIYAILRPELIFADGFE